LRQVPDFLRKEPGVFYAWYDRGRREALLSEDWVHYLLDMDESMLGALLDFKSMRLHMGDKWSYPYGYDPWPFNHEQINCFLHIVRYRLYGVD
jgi:hypothetical protein